MRSLFEGASSSNQILCSDNTTADKTNIFTGSKEKFSYASYADCFTSVKLTARPIAKGKSKKQKSMKTGKKMKSPKESKRPKDRIARQCLYVVIRIFINVCLMN